jgi:hypothetical protein
MSEYNEPFVKFYLSMDEAKALQSILDNVKVGPILTASALRVGELNGNTRAAVILGYRLAADIHLAENPMVL